MAMYSNFITPPDFIQTVLVIDASATEIQQLTEFLYSAEQPYNIYMYSKEMDNLDWLTEAVLRADTVLQQQDSTVPVSGPTKFGPDQDLKNPSEYFNK